MRQVKGEYVPSATPGTLTVSNVALGTVLPGARYGKYEGELAISAVEVPNVAFETVSVSNATLGTSTHADPFRLCHEDPALKPT